jgi:hypothetical protein
MRSSSGIVPRGTRLACPHLEIEEPTPPNVAPGRPGRKTAIRWIAAASSGQTPQPLDGVRADDDSRHKTITRAYAIHHSAGYFCAVVFVFFG